MALTPEQARDFVKNSTALQTFGGTSSVAKPLTIQEVTAEFHIAYNRFSRWVAATKPQRDAPQYEVQEICFGQIVRALLYGKAAAVFSNTGVPSNEWVADHLGTAGHVFFKLSPVYLQGRSTQPASWDVSVVAAVATGAPVSIVTRQLSFHLDALPILWIAILPALRLLQASYYPRKSYPHPLWPAYKHDFPVYEIAADSGAHNLLFYALQAGAAFEDIFKRHCARGGSLASATHLTIQVATPSGGRSAASAASEAAVGPYNEPRDPTPPDGFILYTDNCDGTGTRLSYLEQDGGARIWRYDSLTTPARFVWVKVDKTSVPVEIQSDGTFKVKK